MARITDKERLDWLSKWQGKLEACWQTVGGLYVFGDMAKLFTSNPDRGVYFKSYRQAIDAAIKAERKPKEAGR